MQNGVKIFGKRLPSTSGAYNTSWLCVFGMSSQKFL